MSDQAICGGPRGCAATIGAGGAAISMAAGSDSPADAACSEASADGGGAAALTAPPAQHGACAQWCSLDAGSGTLPPGAAVVVRVTEQKSPGGMLAGGCAYAATGAATCIAAATSARARCRNRFIAESF
jgi:hypothetical protein